MLEKMEVVEQMFNEESKTKKDILQEDSAAYLPDSFKFDYERFFTADAGRNCKSFCKPKNIF